MCKAFATEPGIFQVLSSLKLYLMLLLFPFKKVNSVLREEG
jgi:hypothetical protein